MALLSRKSRTEAVSDPVKLLVADHQKVERIFKQIEKTDEPNMRQGLMAQLTFELERHTDIEEQILYPFIREHVPSGDEMMDHAENEHAEAKEVLRTVSALDVNSPDFRPSLKRLWKLVQDHVKEEEKSVFPKFEKSADTVTLNGLRGDLERAKLAATPTPMLPDDSAPAGGSRRRRAATSAARPKSAGRSKTRAAAKGAVLVQKRDDGSWEVRRENASRASRVFGNKREAEKFGRGVAKREDVDLRT